MTPRALRALLFAAVGATLIFPAEARERVLRAQAPAPPMPGGTNALLGRVIEVGTDAPVGGAIVTLAGHFDASGKPATPGALGVTRELPPTLSVMTTADGYFVFRHLPAGQFTVTTRALGYVNNDFPPTVVEVRESQKTTDVQLRVWKNVTIGGRVVDERGEPVTGLPVNALRRVASGGRVLLRRGGAPVLTDDRGVYRIADLAPGDYTVGVLSTTTTLPASVAAALDPSPANRETYMAWVRELMQSGYSRTYGCDTCISSSHEGHHVAGLVLQRPGTPLPPAPDGSPLGYANTFYPGTQRAQEATMVSLGSGESRTDLDLAVRLTPTVVVSGVVSGPDGPMKHLALTLAPPGTDLNDFEKAGTASAVTDGRGGFAFLAVTPGEYLLTGSLTRIVNEATYEGQPLWASQSLTVGDTGIAGVTITMQPGVRASGTLEFRGASAATDKPSQRQVIFLQPVRAESWRTLPAVVQPDATFRTAGDPPGRYIINMSSVPGWFWQTTSIGGKPLLDEMIDLGAAELSGLVFTFGKTTNRVSGRVTSGSGEPDPDAAVIVFPADSDAWREGILMNRRVRRVNATSAGSYEIATLAPGNYYLAAVSTRIALNWQDPEFLARLVGGATRLTLGAEDERTVPLRTLTPSRR